MQNKNIQKMQCSVKAEAEVTNLLEHKWLI